MRGYNHCSFIGNLTRDVEVRQTGKGTSVANASLAVNRTRKVNGQPVDEVLFLDLVFWSQAADIISKYAHKGDALHVDGELKQNEYTTRDGDKRVKYELNVNNFNLLTPKSQRDDRPRDDNRGNRYQDDGSIPF